MYGVSFLKMIELVGLFPWKTCDKQRNDFNYRGHFVQSSILPTKFTLLSLFMVTGGQHCQNSFLLLTLCGRIFSRASPLKPLASSSFLASSVVLPVIRASVWARKLANRIYSQTHILFYTDIIINLLMLILTFQIRLAGVYDNRLHSVIYYIIFYCVL